MRPKQTDLPFEAKAKQAYLSRLKQTGLPVEAKAEQDYLLRQKPHKVDLSVADCAVHMFVCALGSNNFILHTSCSDLLQ